MSLMKDHKDLEGKYSRLLRLYNSNALQSSRGNDAEKNRRSTSRGNTNNNSGPKKVDRPEMSKSNYGVSNAFVAQTVSHYQSVTGQTGNPGNITGFIGNTNANNVRRSNSINKSGSGRSQNRSDSLTKNHKREDSQASKGKKSKDLKETKMGSIMDVKLKFDEDTINNSVLTSCTGLINESQGFGTFDAAQRMVCVGELLAKDKKGKL
jgi:hypothetical protein